MNEDKKITISKRALRFILNWAYNFGKNDGWEYRYREKREEKLNKLFKND